MNSGKVLLSDRIMTKEKNKLITLIALAALTGWIYSASTIETYANDAVLGDNVSTIIPDYDEFIAENGNNDITVKSSSFYEFSNQLENWANTLDGLLFDIDFDADFEDLEKICLFIRSLRNCDEYSIFLNYILKQEDYRQIRAVLYSFEHIAFDYITADEENFVITVLSKGDVQLQARAFDTVIAWGKVSCPERLKHIELKNYYLQKEFEKFVGKIL